MAVLVSRGIAQPIVYLILFAGMMYFNDSQIYTHPQLYPTTPVLEVTADNLNNAKANAANTSNAAPIPIAFFISPKMKTYPLHPDTDIPHFDA